MYCQDCGTLNSVNTVLCISCRYLLQMPEPSEIPSTVADLIFEASDTLLHDRYRLLFRLGQGGFGSVFKAQDTRSQNKIVAIKEISLTGLQPQEMLDYMHTHHPPIIFRDLKPSNVMLLPNGSVCLIDFGIARYFKLGQFKDLRYSTYLTAAPANSRTRLLNGAACSS